MIRTYSEMKKLKSYTERLEYLKLLDNEHLSPRHMSMEFYNSSAWRNHRKTIIDRDHRFDLGVFGVYIDGYTYVHHINPITEYDLINMTDKVLDPENLITLSDRTHKLIHYNKKEPDPYIEREPGDTIEW